MNKELPKRRALFQAGAIPIGIIAIAALTGCVGIQILENLKDSDLNFREVRARIQAIQRDCPDRQGQARRFRLLVHDGSSCKVVKLSIPGWVADACLRAGEEELPTRGELRIERCYDLNGQSIRDLAKAGPGLLLEVENKKHRVLIGLE